jgi:hypothetical protein
MKKIRQILTTIISLIILTFFVSSVQAQVCEGDYWIYSSYEMDVLSGCTEITGNLIIGSNQYVNTTFENLDGLESLITVGGNLRIKENNSLTSLTGLENITSVGGELFVGSNPLLTSISVFSNITSVSTDLNINNNDALESLSGLDNITSVGGAIYINNNDIVPSLNPLANITSVGEHLEIFHNDALTSLNGLENLTSVDGSLSINGNSSLTSMTGLENLIGVGGDLVILNNEALTNLCALYNVNLGANTLVIAYNNALSIDTVFALSNQLKINGFTGITATGENNGYGLVVCDIDDDIDDDGVLNEDDECEDTPVDEIVNSYGCSIEQLVPCDGDWRNHGKYVSALAKTANSFVYESLISEDEKDILMDEMASSDCGK